MYAPPTPSKPNKIQIIKKSKLFRFFQLALDTIELTVYKQVFREKNYHKYRTAFDIKTC